MSIISRFNQAMGFTRNEARIVLFLAATFLAGIGIKTYRSHVAEGPGYGYASVDSEFQARSAAAESLLSAGGELPPGGAAPVNVNTATASELTALPGIGEKIAAGIIEYRKSNGKFNSRADLLNVRGIGKKKLERISQLITTGD